MTPSRATELRGPARNFSAACSVAPSVGRPTSWKPPASSTATAERPTATTTAAVSAAQAKRHAPGTGCGEKPSTTQCWHIWATSCSPRTAAKSCCGGSSAPRRSCASGCRSSAGSSGLRPPTSIRGSAAGAKPSRRAVTSPSLGLTDSGRSGPSARTSSASSPPRPRRPRLRCRPQARRRGALSEAAQDGPGRPAERRGP